MSDERRIVQPFGHLTTLYAVCWTIKTDGLKVHLHCNTSDSQLSPIRSQCFFFCLSTSLYVAAQTIYIFPQGKNVSFKKKRFPHIFPVNVHGVDVPCSVIFVDKCGHNQNVDKIRTTDLEPGIKGAGVLCASCTHSDRQTCSQWLRAIEIPCSAILFHDVIRQWSFYCVACCFLHRPRLVSMLSAVHSIKMPLSWTDSKKMW